MFFDFKVDEVLICHRCDNPRCCNPAHLILADAKYNTQDMVSKGRKHLMQGEDNSLSKLTEDDVDEMRWLFRMGATRKALAAEYSVARANVDLIVTNKTWKHI